MRKDINPEEIIGNALSELDKSNNKFRFANNNDPFELKRIRELIDHADDNTLEELKTDLKSLYEQVENIDFGRKDYHEYFKKEIMYNINDLKILCDDIKGIQKSAEELGLNRSTKTPEDQLELLSEQEEEEVEEELVEDTQEVIQPPKAKTPQELFNELPSMEELKENLATAYFLELTSTELFNILPIEAVQNVINKTDDESLLQDCTDYLEEIRSVFSEFAEQQNLTQKEAILVNRNIDTTFASAMLKRPDEAVEKQSPQKSSDNILFSTMLIDLPEINAVVNQIKNGESPSLKEIRRHATSSDPDILRGCQTYLMSLKDAINSMAVSRRFKRRSVIDRVDSAKEVTLNLINDLNKTIENKSSDYRLNFELTNTDEDSAIVEFEDDEALIDVDELEKDDQSLIDVSELESSEEEEEESYQSPSRRADTIIENIFGEVNAMSGSELDEELSKPEVQEQLEKIRIRDEIISEGKEGLQRVIAQYKIKLQEKTDELDQVIKHRPKDIEALRNNITIGYANFLSDVRNIVEQTSQSMSQATKNFKQLKNFNEVLKNAGYTDSEITDLFNELGEIDKQHEELHRKAEKNVTIFRGLKRRAQTKAQKIKQRTDTRKEQKKIKEENKIKTTPSGTEEKPSVTADYSARDANNLPKSYDEENQANLEIEEEESSEEEYIIPGESYYEKDKAEKNKELQEAVTEMNNAVEEEIKEQLLEDVKTPVSDSFHKKMGKASVKNKISRMDMSTASTKDYKELSQILGLRQRHADLKLKIYLHQIIGSDAKVFDNYEKKLSSYIEELQTLRQEVENAGGKNANKITEIIDRQLAETNKLLSKEIPKGKQGLDIGQRARRVARLAKKAPIREAAKLIGHLEKASFKAGQKAKTGIEGSKRIQNLISLAKKAVGKKEKAGPEPDTSEKHEP